MRKTQQIAWGLLCFGWALSVLVLGLVLLMPDTDRGDTRLMGLAMVAAAAFFVMWLVIDRLIPDAGPVFTGTLKLAALVVFYASGVLTLVYA